MDKEMTLGDVRQQLREALTPKYGEREAAAMARAILTHLKGWDLPTLLANEQREAGDYVKGMAADILKKLMADMPLQYALGETTFYGLKLKVAPGVLIPRPETEELTDMIVKDHSGEEDLRVLDLCTGSGAIALALSRNLPFSDVTAIDNSEQALKTARENADALKAKVRIEKHDVFDFDPEAGSYDIIVSNPPYVDESEKAGMDRNVLDYEPAEALFVPDDDPLLYYRRIAQIGMKALHPGGRLYFEINPRHADEMKALLRDAGYEEITLTKDFNRHDRFATAKKPD